MPPPCHAPIRALPPNHRGHDYFVGDIHAHFSRLEDALAKRGFRPEVDRLIAVGDLIDRGPESGLATRWLEQPWFSSIRGNHEDLYLGWRSLKDDPISQRVYERDGYKDNGGHWMSEIGEVEHQQLEAAVAALPYLLTVPAGGRIIAVVHAEMPADAAWPTLLIQPFQPEWVRPMTWGRDVWRSWRQQTDLEPWVEGLDAVVVGHTPVRSPQVWGNYLFLDSGGWRKNGQFVLARADEVLAWVDGVSDPPPPAERTSA